MQTITRNTEPSVYKPYLAKFLKTNSYTYSNT